MSPFEKPESAFEGLKKLVFELDQVEQQLTDPEKRHEAAVTYRIAIDNHLRDVRANEPGNVEPAEDLKKAARKVIEKLEA